jgi:Uma2 family endonuclease
MATALTQWPFVYFPDLQAHLGGIPAYRIRLQPPPGRATELDVLEVRGREGRICELVDGVLVEKDMASYQSIVAGVLIYFLRLYVEEHDLGQILGEGGLLRLASGLVRAPDVSFISWKHMPNQEFPDEPIASLAPDLAVEVLSVGNTPLEMERKRSEYFQAGCKLVWMVDTEARTVEVYTSARRSVLLTEDDTLDGGKVLPGFSLPIKQWFARARRRPQK